jgi:hypothetical protein
MNKKIKVVVFLLGALGCQEAFAGWQPMPRIGVDMDPTKFVYVVAPYFVSDIAYKAFGNDKHSIGLDKFVFGKTVQIKDVFLASRIAGLGDTNVNAGSYLSLLSTTTMVMEASQHRDMFSVEWSLNTALGSSDVLLTTGITVPFEYYEQDINVEYEGAALGSDYSTTPITTTNPGFFFTKYPDMDGFVQTEILDPKGLSLKNFQRSFGVGAIRLFSMLDFSNYWTEATKRLQIGFVAHLDAPQTENANIVWPIERGLGATYVGGFAQVYLNFNAFLKPFIVAEVTGAVAKNMLMRVPVLKTVTGAQAAANITFGNADVLSGTFNTSLVTAPFSFYDSSVPFFSDETLLVRRRRGALQLVKFGNSFDLGGIAQLDVWYEHAHRMQDKITRSSKADPTTESNTYDFEVVTRNTRNSYHIFAWQMIYGFQDSVDDGFEGAKITLGTQHVIKGKNAPQYQSAFVQLEFGF